MPSSNSRIIRGQQTSNYSNWNMKSIGAPFESHVDRLLTEISREHPQEGMPPPPVEQTEEEIRLQHWGMELKEREAQLIGLEEEAVERGIKQGQQQGYQAGYQEAQHERTLLQDATESLHREFEQFKHKLSEKLLDLALLTSKKILADTLTLHPENAALLLEQFIESMQLNGQAVTLRCNAATQHAIKKHLGEVNTLAQLRFIEDKQQLGNGFILQHPEGEIDATLQTRWLKIIEALGKNTPLTQDDIPHE